MKKIIIIISMILLCVWGGLFILQNSQDFNFSLPLNTKDSWIKSTSTQENDSDEIAWESSDIKNEDIVRAKIENIKKRLALKWLIIQWDTYYRNHQLTLALKQYLEFYREYEEDPLIIEKIANTYFAMHKYNTAFSYYQKIVEPDMSIRVRMATMSFYEKNISNEDSKNQIRNTLDNIELTEEQRMYYKTALSCVDDFSFCKTTFEEYFWPVIEVDVDGNTIWVDEWGKELVFENTISLKEAIQNYKNFQVEDPYLLDAYIIWSFYTSKLYPVALELSEKLLIDRPGYKPAQKIIAQSYYELGEYIKAKSILTDYYENDDSDPRVAYLLWVINEKLGEYILANIYLNKALDLWYTPSINVRRQLIHNFYLLENDENMLRSFTELVNEEEDIEHDDLGLAIYHHIIHEKYDEALEWSKKGQESFPENSNFYGYESWIYRVKWDFTTALDTLQLGLAIDKENPFIIINIGYTLLEIGNEAGAKRYFNQILEIAPGSEFAKQAQQELEKM